MKIIQTIVNCIDFQSRIIELDMTWKDFKEYILSHIHEGIHDDEIRVKKSYPIGKGLLLGSVVWYEVNQDDDVHLDIELERTMIPYTVSERVCFLVFEK